MDRGDRQTHPVRRLRHWLSQLIRVWVWESATDTGFSVFDCLYCLRSSSLRLRMFWVVSLRHSPHTSTISCPGILLFFLVLCLVILLCVFVSPTSPLTKYIHVVSLLLHASVFIVPRVVFASVVPATLHFLHCGSGAPEPCHIPPKRSK